MTRQGMALFALLLVAAPAAAQGDAEERFHQAYAREVVEGDVKGAAVVYLSLQNDPDAPPVIRAESRFRFAVCAVLLGRADEGRAVLADLVRDPETPESVRKKAEEYRAAVAGIGVGTELSKKLQALVFDLGRASPAKYVEAYRDFEIIGEPALPFLRKLLHHRDQRLRTHAFRLLCRMGEPGMAALWVPDDAPGGAFYNADLTRYLTLHPEEREAFEKRVLALGDKAVSRLTRMAPAPGFSLAFLRALAAKEAWRSTALWFLNSAGEPGPRHALIAEWIRGSNQDLSRETSLWLLTYSPSRLPDVLASPEVFRVVVARLSGPGSRPLLPTSYPQANGLRRLALSQSVPELLEALEIVIAAGERREEEYRPPNPLIGVLPEVLASVLDSKLGPDADVRAYLGLLDRWARIDETLLARRERREVRPRPVPDKELARHYRAAVRALPEEAAVTEIGRLLDLLEPGNGTTWLRDLYMPVDSPSRVRVLVETVRKASPRLRPALLFLLPVRKGSASEVELVDAAVDALAEVWDRLSPEERRIVLRRVLDALQAPAAADGESGKARAALRSFLRAHYRDMDGNLFGYLARTPGVVPLEEWIPLAPAGITFPARPAQGELDRVARVLGKDAAKANDAAVEFILRYASPELRMECFERGLMLRDRSARRRYSLRLGSVTGKLPGSDVLERCLAIVLEEEDPDLHEVSAVARILYDQRPSKKLFPAVRLLLASEDRGGIQTGVQLARSLGREELVPDLVRLLDSMDAGIRTWAKQAIDSIRDVTRMKEEERQREKGLLPK